MGGRMTRTFGKLQKPHRLGGIAEPVQESTN
jgi:hypothetical protein